LAYVASGLVEEVFQLSKKARGEGPLLAGEAKETPPGPQELRLITNQKE